MKPFCALLALVCSAEFAFANPTSGQIKVAEKIATLMAKGDFDEVRGYFNRALKQSLTVKQMEQAWNALIAQTGEFERVTKSGGTTAQGFDVVEVLCAARQGNLVVRAVFDPREERLNGLWIAPVGHGGENQKPSTPKKPSFPE
jgi:hypothetical protein